MLEKEPEMKPICYTTVTGEKGQRFKELPTHLFSAN